MDEKGILEMMKQRHQKLHAGHVYSVNETNNIGRTYIICTSSNDTDSLSNLKATKQMMSKAILHNEFIANILPNN